MAGTKESNVARRNDHAVAEFYDAYKLMARHKDQTIREVSLIKVNAFRAAERLIEMLDRDAEWLRKHCKSLGVSVDQWCDKHFEPLAWVGEDWRDLVHLVREGVPMAKYVDMRGVVLTARLRSDKASKDAGATDRPIPPVPDSSIPTEQQAIQLRACVESLEESNKRLRAENAALKKEVAVLRATIEKVNRDIKAAVAA